MEADTVVKMSLVAFCKEDIKINGMPLVDKLRKQALQMQELVVEVYHLINLHFLERCEQVASDQPPQPISGRPYDADPRIEPKWDGKRVLEYFYAVARHEHRQSAVPAVEIMRAQERLYNQLRKDHLPRPEGATDKDQLWLVSRLGLHVNSLLHVANRIAAVINTNIRQHFYPRQQQHITLRDNLPTKIAAKCRQMDINSNAHRGRTHDESLPYELLTDSVEWELQKHPERFLYPMWCMNKLREEKGESLFSVLPLSCGFVPGACLHIDTDALCAIVGGKHNNLLAHYYKMKSSPA